MNWAKACAVLLGLFLAVLFNGVAVADTVAPLSTTVDLGVSVWAFRVVAVVAIAFAIAMVMMRSAVVAALMLVMTLIAIGVLYLLLHASFMAAIQVLVYAGAIIVLFVFVVMSVGHPDKEEWGIMRYPIAKLMGVGAVLLILAKLFPLLKGAIPGASAQAVNAEFGTVKHIGTFLFSDYLFPFEAISVLLLVAIVAAVMVSRKQVR